MLASLLLRAVPEIRLEYVGYLQEPLQHGFDARGLVVPSHVPDQREQAVPPEHHVGVQNFGNVREELLRIDLFQEAGRLQVFQAGQKYLENNNERVR